MNIRKDLYQSLHQSDTLSLLDFLNHSPYDDLFEIDLANDAFHRIYHTPNKYALTGQIEKYSALYEYIRDRIIHPEDKEIYASLMDPSDLLERLKNSKIPNFLFSTFRYKLLGGDYRYVEQCLITGKDFGLPEGEIRVYIFDVHNLVTRTLGKMPSQEGQVDLVTGLFTGSAFLMEAEAYLKHNQDRKWCLVSLDIRHSHFFTEWYGKDQFEALLSEIGALIRESDDINLGVGGYFGGDDFAVLMPFDMDLITALYEKIRALILSYGLSYGFMPAFGVAEIEPGMMVADVYDRSNIAVNKAKSDIRNHIIVYNPNLRFQSENEHRVLSEFIHAFRNDEITFFLQPQCRISTHKVVGAEALARWVKKDGTIVYPGYFVPMLEKYGFVIDLDQFIWEKACQTVRRWIDEGLPLVPISVNVSRTDIYSLDVHQHFVELMDRYQLPHKALKIEITESAYVEAGDVIAELVKKLRRDGFIVLMDDFGSGYSSLNMLSSLEVDAIKLDANFLHIEGADYEKGIRILESVVNMAKQMALPIIVEGVETKKQCDFLEELGCRYVQGFYFYRALPLSEFEDLIRDGSNVDGRGFVVKLNEQFRLREFLDKNVYSDSMLNSIIGSVALYSWHDDHIDIVRFNQQFYEAVNVPDFHERLTCIEQFVPEEDKPALFGALEKAKENRLSGASATVRFARIDGTHSFFSIRFYYLGHKEGGDRFYGTASNVSDMMELVQERRLIAKYSSDSMIFIRRIFGKWVYSVASHDLSDIFALSPKQLEEEMNDGRFAKRVVDAQGLAAFMKEAADLAENKKDFEHEISIYDIHQNPRKILLSFTYVGDEATNIAYLLRTKVLD